MLWLTLAVITGIAVATRLWAVRDSDSTVWWWAGSGSLMAIVAGSAFLTAEAEVNATLGVTNIAYLLSNLSFIAAAGAVQVFCHCLRTEEPSGRWIAIHLGTAVAVGAVVVFGWVIAPVHDVAYERFRLAPITPESVLYDVVFHVYLGLVLLNTGICAYTQVGRTEADPGRRAGGLIIAVGCLIDVPAHLLYLTRIALQPIIGAPALKFADVADQLTVLCVLGVAGGMAFFQLAPRLRHLVRTHQLAARLRPAWLRVRELIPSVMLPGDRMTNRIGIRAERMLIELSDAMRNLPINRTAGTDPIKVVARAMITPPDNPDGMASDILPTPTSRHDEEVTAIAVAQAYAAARLESRTHAS